MRLLDRALLTLVPTILIAPLWIGSLSHAEETGAGLSIGLTQASGRVSARSEPDRFAMTTWSLRGIREQTGAGQQGHYETNDPADIALIGAVAQDLASRFGPAWNRQGLAGLRTGAGSVLLTGPDSGVHGRSDELGRAAAASLDHIVALRRAEAATAEALAAPGLREQTAATARRDAAQAAAAEAESRLEAAAVELRVSTTILSVFVADAEQVAGALKAALPWATFAAVGGRQIVASGTAQELKAAGELAGHLDLEATLSAERLRERQMVSPIERFRRAPIEIDFAGGALAGYLEALAKASGFQTWIVEDPRLLEATLPPIRLVGATGDSALRALSGLTLRLERFGTDSSVRLEVDEVGPLAEDAGDAAQPVFRIRGAVGPTPARPVRAAEDETQHIQVFPLHPPDDQDDPAAFEKLHAPLLGAIETAISMRGETSTLKLRLHPASRLLFVGGNASDLVLVREIIAAWQSQH